MKQIQLKKEQVARDNNAGGTLIIAQKSLFDQWMKEFDQKLKSGALNVKLFHGPRRIQKVNELTSYDVVITSYETLVSESKKDGLLFKIKFHRIVLDEGYNVKNVKTKQSEAVQKLQGDRRWIMTSKKVCCADFMMNDEAQLKSMLLSHHRI